MRPQLEKITSPPHGSFKVFRYKSQYFDAPWHFHPEYELTYIANSSGMRYVGDNVMEFKKGDLVLLGRNLPHCWKNTESQNEMAESIVIQWNNELLGINWLEQSEFGPIKKLIGLSSRGIQFTGATVQHVLDHLSPMPALPPFQKLVSLLQILNLLATTKNYQLLSGDNFATNLNEKTNTHIDRIQNYIAIHYHEKITLKDVSGLVHMSEETFCRFFKRTYNKSFFTFLNEYKIKLACKLLIESHRQVSEIAFQCGYESLPFFYRQFKKFMGCSPLVYQKKYTANLSS